MSPAGCRRLHAGSVGSPDRRGRCQRAFVFTGTGTRGELRCYGRGAARSLPLVMPEPSPSEGFPPTILRRSRALTHQVRGAHASCVLSSASLRRRSVPLMSPAGCRRLHAGSVGSPDRRGRCQRAFVFTGTGTRGELRCYGRGAARSLPLVMPEPSPSEGFPPIVLRGDWARELDPESRLYRPLGDS